jgi:hypothetical protein
MPELYKTLNIDTSNILAKSFDPWEYRKTRALDPNGRISYWGLQGDDMREVISQDWLDYMKSLGIDIDTLLIFYRDKDLLYHNVHVDVEYVNNKLMTVNYALNFVLDENDDGEMIWYDLPDQQCIEDNVEILSNGNPYCTWSLENLPGPEIARQCIAGKTLTLLNTQYPHNVQTHTRPRWAFSFRCPDDVHITFDQALEKFSKWS